MATTIADRDGWYRVTRPIGSAARFRFIATSGQLPDSGTLGWQSNASYVNVFPTGAQTYRLNVGSAPAGFLVGGHYVFSGRTVPGMPVTIWWDAQPFKGWRVFGRTTAGSDGVYRLTLPIGSAASFKFMATEGSAPGSRPRGGWETVASAVTVRASVPPTMTLDPRCKTGRVICVSKKESTLAWVVNGKIQFTMDVRFGSSRLPTRNGAFKVTWKSRNHVSSIYHSAMPFSLFFDGGRAVHYSRSFAEFGYRGNSAGCVNTRDYEQSRILFDLARTGDKVIVF